MANPTGITDLKALIINMEPVLNKGEYIFASVPDTTAIPREMTVCEIKEKEGVTVVVSKKDAEKLGLPFEFVASWITLNIHSSLAAVGLTAAFSAELAQHHISCNVIAGYYHDHIFVQSDVAEQAMHALGELRD